MGKFKLVLFWIFGLSCNIILFILLLTLISFRNPVIWVIIILYGIILIPFGTIRLIILINDLIKEKRNLLDD